MSSSDNNDQISTSTSTAAAAATESTRDKRPRLSDEFIDEDENNLRWADYSYQLGYDLGFNTGTAHQDTFEDIMGDFDDFGDGDNDESGFEFGDIDNPVTSNEICSAPVPANDAVDGGQEEVEEDEEDEEDMEFEEYTLPMDALVQEDVDDINDMDNSVALDLSAYNTFTSLSDDTTITLTSADIAEITSAATAATNSKSDDPATAKAAALKEARALQAKRRKERLMAHVLHAPIAIAFEQRCNRRLNSPLLQSILLSILPCNLVEQVCRRGYGLTKAGLVDIVEQFGRKFPLDDQSTAFILPSVDEFASAFGQDSSGVLAVSARVRAMLFTALFRALSTPARHVVSLQPPNILASASSTLSSSSSSSSSSSKRKATAARAPSSHFDSPQTVWTEVYLLTEQRWICINTTTGAIDNSRSIESPQSHQLNGSKPMLAYVLGFGSDLYARDVTRRYSNQFFIHTLKLRASEEWWMGVMSDIARLMPTDRERSEDAELVQVELNEKMPTRLNDFKNHPLYALEKLLGQHEVIYPKEPIIAQFKGEPVYPAVNVQKLKSKEAWLRLGKSIKHNEEPIKHIETTVTTVKGINRNQRKPTSGSGGRGGGNKYAKANSKFNRTLDSDSENENEEDIGDRIAASLAEGDAHAVLSAAEMGMDGAARKKAVALFGKWQTEQYVAQPVVDGIVTRNQFGNIELFHPSMLPAGGAHVTIEGAAKVARNLGISFAHAIIGFEFKSRMAMPVRNGIVVPAEWASVIEEACSQVEEHEQQMDKLVKDERALILWKRVISSLLLAQRIGSHSINSKPEPIVIDDDDYDDDDDDDEEEEDEY